MTHNREIALRGIIDAQGGFFTLKQACEIGFSKDEVASHTRLRKWIQELDEVFRLPRYRYGYRADLIPSYLWVKERSGPVLPVFSHHTALEVYELIDLLPMYTHITLNTGAPRLHKVCYGIVLHYEELPPADIQHIEWLPLTTLKRTIIDLAREGRLSFDIIQVVYQRALENKFIESKDELLAHFLVQKNPQLYKVLSEL